MDHGHAPPTVPGVLAGPPQPAQFPATRRRRRAGGTLTFGAWQTPETMDPQKTGLAATSRILFQSMTPLVWKFPGDDNFYPGLAERWEISSDGREYTFWLRNDVRFHNG